MSIEVKLVVDKKNQKVLFADCDTDFVDVLFSFLTLPLGTIVRLLNKQFEVGCMEKLYKSVEDLDAVKYLQTTPCKTMLLQPRSIAAAKWEELVVNICDDLNLKSSVFWCPEWECAWTKFPHYSSASGVKCSCGKFMDKIVELPKAVSTDGVFVKEAAVRFLVTDDLRIFAMSSVSVAFAFLGNLDNIEPTDVEEKTIQVNKAQILSLLRASFVSKTPLTDVFLGKTTVTATEKNATSFIPKVKIESNSAPTKQSEGAVTATVKILESNKVQLLDAGNDFVDLIFSFLTYPLGCVLSLLYKSTSVLGCIHNVYTSIDNMKAGNSEDILSLENKKLLLDTKLPPYFGCGNQILKVDEIQSCNYNVKICTLCFRECKKMSCPHSAEDYYYVPTVQHSELNPKLIKVSAEKGGGFVKPTARFIITDDVVVKPVSIVSTMQVLKELGVSANSFLERTVIVDETKALKFLEACLTSSTGIIDSLLH